MFVSLFFPGCNHRMNAEKIDDMLRKPCHRNPSMYHVWYMIYVPTVLIRKNNGMLVGKYTLQGTNISYLEKRNNIFKSAFRRGYVSSLEGTSPIEYLRFDNICMSNYPTRVNFTYYKGSDLSTSTTSLSNRLLNFSKQAFYQKIGWFLLW